MGLSSVGATPMILTFAACVVTGYILALPAIAAIRRFA